MGRKARADITKISTENSETPYGIGNDGPIVKPSTAYASSKLPMVIDEDWYGYIGYHGDMSYSWDNCDPIMDIVDAFVGDYHGTPIKGVSYTNGQWDVNDMRKRGSVAMYDGHVELVRDWLPRKGDNNDTGGRQFPFPAPQEVIDVYFQMIGQFFYSQQGKTTVDLFGG